MAEILYDPDTTVEDFHKCWKELPGKLVDTDDPKYFTGVKNGTVVLCSCGKVYMSIYTGYQNLGCKYKELGWWESRSYKKKAGRW